MNNYQKAVRMLRRTLGIARLKRESRLVDFEGRKQKAWRVPGTREAGEHAMLVRRMDDSLKEQGLL